MCPFCCSLCSFSTFAGPSSNSPGFLCMIPRFCNHGIARYITIHLVITNATSLVSFTAFIPGFLAANLRSRWNNRICSPLQQPPETFPVSWRPSKSIRKISSKLSFNKLLPQTNPVDCTHPTMSLHTPVSGNKAIRQPHIPPTSIWSSLRTLCCFVQHARSFAVGSFRAVSAYQMQCELMAQQVFVCTGLALHESCFGVV